MRKGERVSFSVLAAPRGFDSKLRVRLPAVIIMDTSHPMDGRVRAGGTEVPSSNSQTDEQTERRDRRRATARTRGIWVYPTLLPSYR